MIVKHSEFMREFRRSFRPLTERHGAGAVWGDWIYSCAVYLSLGDRLQAPERFKEFLRIWNRYAPDEQQTLNRLFGLLVDFLEQAPFSDLLGELYADLELANTHNGQFFTPPGIGRMMGQITLLDAAQRISAEPGWISLSDPACGSGSLLIAAAQTLSDQGVNYQDRCFFVAQDIAPTAGLMCFIQLSLLGCAGVVKIGNTLTNPFTGDPLQPPSDPTIWQMPRNFTQPWAARKLLSAIRSQKTIGAQTEPVTPYEAPEQKAPF